jgi:hypothetical protein
MNEQALGQQETREQWTLLGVALLRDYIDPTIAATSTIMVLISSLLPNATQIIGKR